MKSSQSNLGSSFLELNMLEKTLNFISDNANRRYASQKGCWQKSKFSVHLDIVLVALMGFRLKAIHCQTRRARGRTITSLRQKCYH